MHKSKFYTSWCVVRVALYGSTTVSETFGDGYIEYDKKILSGNSSLSFDIRRLPNPDPVPPPTE